jgi:hypothetical protein
MATLSSPTLQSLITSVRTLLNQPDPLNSFWKDEELKQYINEAIRLYFVEVAQNNEGLFTTTASLNIVSGTETVALPSDCFEVKALYKAVDNGYVILEYRNNMTESYSTQGGGDGNSYCPSYYFRQNNLVLRPVPNFSQTAGLLIEYIQFPETLINGGDSLSNQISPVFRQVIEMYAVYKAKLKESMVSGVVMHKIPEENLGALATAFRDAIQLRAKSPVYILPFNP